MRIVIPGGSGQVGNILARHFHAQGHAVVVLSRASSSAREWVADLEHADVCINLAGRSVNCRYNEANRRIIYESRVLTKRLINDVNTSLRHPPRIRINASTATIYRHAMDRPMDEETGELGGDEAGAPDMWNFSIGVAKAWEREFFATSHAEYAQDRDTGAIYIQPGSKRGVFDVLLGLVRHGLGGTQGSGDQFISWIPREPTSCGRSICWSCARR